MIKLHRLHGNGELLLNPDLIETMEACPDTTIQLITRHRYVVEDSIDEVVEKIIAFKAEVKRRSSHAAVIAHGEKRKAA